MFTWAAVFRGESHTVGFHLDPSSMLSSHRQKCIFLKSILDNMPLGSWRPHTGESQIIKDLLQLFSCLSRSGRKPEDLLSETPDAERRKDLYETWLNSKREKGVTDIEDVLLATRDAIQVLGSKEYKEKGREPLLQHFLPETLWLDELHSMDPVSVDIAALMANEEGVTVTAAGDPYLPINFLHGLRAYNENSEEASPLLRFLAAVPDTQVEVIRCRIGRNGDEKEEEKHNNLFRAVAMAAGDLPSELPSCFTFAGETFIAGSGQRSLFSGGDGSLGLKIFPNSGGVNTEIHEIASMVAESWTTLATDNDGTISKPRHIGLFVPTVAYVERMRSALNVAGVSGNCIISSSHTASNDITRNQHVRSAISLIRCITTNHSDQIALLQVLRSYSSCSAGMNSSLEEGGEISQILASHARRREPLINALERASLNDVPLALRVMNDLRWVKGLSLSGVPAKSIVLAWLERVNALESMLNPNNEDDAEAADAMTGLFEVLEELETRFGVTDILEVDSRLGSALSSTKLRGGSSTSLGYQVIGHELDLQQNTSISGANGRKFGFVYVLPLFTAPNCILELEEVFLPFLSSRNVPGSNYRMRLFPVDEVSDPILGWLGTKSSFLRGWKAYLYAALSTARSRAYMSFSAQSSKGKRQGPSPLLVEICDERTVNEMLKSISEKELLKSPSYDDVKATAALPHYAEASM